MTTLTKIHFLVHGFCYAESFAGDSRWQSYLGREEVCAASWRRRLQDMGPTEALAIIPWPAAGKHTATFLATARSLLGPGCLLLDTPFRAFHGSPARDANREEHDTAGHAEACALQLKALLEKAGLAMEPETTAAEGWGASFEGCVMKYTLHLRRALGLRRPIAVPFGLTVPDAEFLLGATCTETQVLDQDMRGFLFDRGTERFALFTRTTEALGDSPRQVRLPPGSDRLIVKSKQGIRLWPNAQPYVLPNVPPEYREGPQEIIRCEGGQLTLPVCAGYVYRLAKAPAFVFAPADMSFAEFRGIIMAAKGER